MSKLEMRGINKSFFSVPVLKNVDFTVEEGEIHALLGENGAGKTTLMNILAGVHVRDSGTIRLEGEIIENPSVKLTESMGIAFVHQELNLFNDLKVYENLYFNKEKTNRLGTLKKREMIAEANTLFKRLGMHIDPNALVGDLTASEKQTVEISKAIFFDARILILDEPTTALSNDEIEHLFGILRTLKGEGKSFIFISHKMPEIFSIADSYTVLRNGNLIGTGKISDVTPDEVTRMMVGESYTTGAVYRSRELEEPVLELINYSGPGFDDVTLKVHRGEVLGLTGLQGSGASQLLWTIFGALPSTGGTLKLHGKTLSRSNIHKIMKNKTALLPPDRKENSVLSDMSLLENMYISEHQLSSSKQHINKKQENHRYEVMRKRLAIKANNSSEQIISLSGGNQQKVFLARWLNTDSDILLLDNPTQGIDVGAKEEIYRLILDLAESGKTILINTLEIPELIKVADNCAVFYNGMLARMLPHEEIDEHTVMLYATDAIQSTGRGQQIWSN
jgi:ribose transport system ATP-binding protein